MISSTAMNIWATKWLGICSDTSCTRNNYFYLVVIGVITCHPAFSTTVTCNNWLNWKMSGSEYLLLFPSYKCWIKRNIGIETRRGLQENSNIPNLLNNLECIHVNVWAWGTSLCLISFHRLDNTTISWCTLQENDRYVRLKYVSPFLRNKVIYVLFIYFIYFFNMYNNGWMNKTLFTVYI